MSATDTKRIDAILNRGVIANILPDKKEFRKQLLSGEKLKFYIGVDPTSTTLHLSHAKNYMLLEEFRQLGHEVIALFGDFTAKIGDPTDRTAARKQLSDEEVKENIEHWLKQIRPLLDLEAKENPPQVLHNSEWLSILSFEKILNLASNFTVQQMIERDMFQNRLQKEQPIYLHEFFYPLMQGYDSVAMEVDVELCGTDQIFNAMVGRTLSKKLLDKNKFVVAVNLMENPETGELMSKSKGTGVFLDSTPEEMFGAIMAQPDTMTKILLVNNTRLPLEEIDEIMQQQPRETKIRAALEITQIFHGKSKAQTARQSWERQFSQGKLPEDIPVFATSKTEWKVEDMLLDSELVKSKSEARRVLAQKGVRINGEPVQDGSVTVSDGDVLQVGKRRFARVKLQ